MQSGMTFRRNGVDRVPERVRLLVGMSARNLARFFRANTLQSVVDVFKGRFARTG